MHNVRQLEVGGFGSVRGEKGFLATLEGFP
jgi:hypothetical protein